ncbi:hypothetical protein CBOM_03071 [Ceraceosorus bombacis]|uniref:Uncharacterized protein n=1 Tax=Ceraceosorus bombacis TaxID=401625 RepID=A0A0P1BKT0_9BASI|nr:hypothetical protein CBOM_03071 [Ceraceosorus bombacis]
MSTASTMFHKLRMAVLLGGILAPGTSMANTPRGFSDNAMIVLAVTGHPECRGNLGAAAKCWSDACNTVTKNEWRVNAIAPADKVGQLWVECTLDIKLRPVPLGSDLDNFTESARKRTGFMKAADQ